MQDMPAMGQGSTPLGGRNDSTGFFTFTIHMDMDPFLMPIRRASE